MTVVCPAELGNHRPCLLPDDLDRRLRDSPPPLSSESLDLTCLLLFIVPKGQQFLRTLAPEGQEELGEPLRWGGVFPCEGTGAHLEDE